MLRVYPTGSWALSDLEIQATTNLLPSSTQAQTLRLQTLRVHPTGSWALSDLEIQATTLELTSIGRPISLALAGYLDRPPFWPLRWPVFWRLAAKLIGWTTGSPSPSCCATSSGTMRGSF